MNTIVFIAGYIAMGPAWMLMIGIALVSLVVQWRFRSEFNQYAHEA